MEQHDTDVLLEVGEAGRRLGISPGRLRDLTAAGRITALRTARGQRLYRLADVERLARERKAARPRP
jgi:excisionase family DNA binding protein